MSVNVGRPRTVRIGDRDETTAIVKSPVDDRRRVNGSNVDGDEQADPEHHGGLLKAVYAYAGEDYDWWAGELGRDLPPGTFGENLTVRGLAVSDAPVGTVWRVGADLVLVLTSPRVPCHKLGWRMGDPGFPRRFAAAGRPGAYFGIVSEGDVGAGDPVEVLRRPDHEVTAALVLRAVTGDHSLAPRLLEAAEHLHPADRAFAERVVDRSRR